MRATHEARHRCIHNADLLARGSPLSAFFIEVVCAVGATPPRTAATPHRTATSPPANGGNCTIRDATRRRHAEGRLLMLQTPHHYPSRVRLRHPKAQGPGGSSMAAPGIGRATPMSARARLQHPLTQSCGGHTQARDAVFAGTRRAPPTKTPTFPHQHAEKSPLQQHVVSYNPGLHPERAPPGATKPRNLKRSRGPVAEDGGFEPPRACTQHAFQACAIGH